MTQLIYIPRQRTYTGETDNYIVTVPSQVMNDTVANHQGSGDECHTAEFWIAASEDNRLEGTGSIVIKKQIIIQITKTDALFAMIVLRDEGIEAIDMWDGAHCLIAETARYCNPTPEGQRRRSIYAGFEEYEVDGVRLETPADLVTIATRFADMPDEHDTRAVPIQVLIDALSA